MPTTPDAVTLCRELVAIPSISGDGAEIEVVAHLRELMARAGADVEVHELRPGRPNLLATFASSRPGPTLLLNGHVDVVSIGDPDLWTHAPFGAEVADGRIWGRGSADMKGGVAALAAAALRVAAAGGPAAGRLVFSATADEDGEGEWGIPAMVEAGLIDADAAIVAEPAGMTRDFETVTIATRGFAFLQVELETPPLGHASGYTSERPHAAALAARLVTAIEAEFRPQPVIHAWYPDGPTVIAGDELHGAGDGVGLLPERARLTLALRLLPGAREETLLDEVDAFVAPRIPAGYRARVGFRDGVARTWAPPLELAHEHPLAQLAMGAVRHHGYPDARFAGWPAFSEGAFLAAAGIPTLPALGPGQICHCHQPDEHVAVASVEAAAAIYEQLIGEILAADSPIAARPGSFA